MSSPFLTRLGRDNVLQQTLRNYLSISNASALSLVCKTTNQAFSANVNENKGAKGKQVLNDIFIGVAKHKVGGKVIETMYLIVPSRRIANGQKGPDFVYFYNLNNVRNDTRNINKLTTMSVQQNEDTPEGLGSHGSEDYIRMLFDEVVENANIVENYYDNFNMLFAPNREHGIHSSHTLFLALSAFDELQYIISCIDEREKEHYIAFREVLKNMLTNALDGEDLLTYTNDLKVSTSHVQPKTKQSGGKLKRKVLKLRF